MIDISSPEPESLDMLYLLERLEEVLADGKRVPGLNRTLVDEEECIAIIDQIRLSLPAELRQARKLTAERDTLLEQARARSDQIVRAAEEEARERAREHVISRQAETRAEEVVARAERQADQIRGEADDYACRVLMDLEHRLEGLMSPVRSGIHSLQADREARQNEETS